MVIFVSNEWYIELRQLVDENLSISKIAKKIGLSKTGTIHRLHKCGLKTNSKHTKSEQQKQEEYTKHQRFKNDRGRQLRNELIHRLGGKCSVCGYSKNTAVLTFHHVNMKDKKFKLDMRSCSNRNYDVLSSEADKCILLCANCHMELHNPQYNINT